MRFSLTSRIRAVPDAVRELREVVGFAAAMAGFGHGAGEEIRLAVNEALANVVKHGYGGDVDGPIRLRIRASVSLVEIVIVDECRPIRPDEICPRSLDDVRPGGLGVHMMRKLMNVVEYRPRVGRGNALRMIRTSPEIEQEP